MKLVTWNVQWCRGIDGVVDPARIISTARALADFDVLCLQEVAVNFPGLPGSRGEDQVAALSRQLPGFSAHFGVATDVDDGKGGRSAFGNLVLTRLPAIQVFRHLLPWPADPGIRSMQRIAIEAILLAPWGPVRVMTTHLEYYSALQRMAQVNALRALHREACGHESAPREHGEPGEPFAAKPRPAAVILTGDFNFAPDSAEYQRMVSRYDAQAVPDFLDAWTLAHPRAPHAPTAGLHENSWAPRPLCCDYAFVTSDLASRVEKAAVDALTQASDHQPLLVEIN